MALEERNTKLNFTPKWAEVMRERRRYLGLSQDALAFDAKVSQSFVSQIERGSQSPIGASVDKFTRLMRELKWTVEDFQKATGLAIDGAETINQTVPAIEIPPKPKRLIPMYDTCAGFGIEAEPMGYIEVDIDEIGDVAFKINGHSMVPTIHSGDVAVVQKDVYKLGEIVAARTIDGVVVKRLSLDDETKLAKLTSDVPDYTVLFDGKVEIIGRVVELRRRLV